MISLVAGASAGLGRALAERLARAGHDLYLIASDERDLEVVAADLRLRFGRRVLFEAADFAAVDVIALRARVLAGLGSPDNLFYIAGASLMDGDDVTDADVQRLIAVNFTAGVRLAHAFLEDLQRSSRATLVGAGSVATIRGRRVNRVYGAAKSGLDTYFAALRHRLAGSTCAVQFYRLGYLDTHMTFGQRTPLPALSADRAADVIAGNLGRDLGAVYLPGWWAPIGFTLRWLPWPIFKRLNI